MASISSSGIPKGDLRTVTAVAFLRDGRVVASSEGPAVHDGDALRPNRIWLWEATTGAQMRHLEGFNCTATSLAFAPDDSQLATGLEDGTLLLWEVSLAMPALPLRGSRLGPKDL